MKINYLQVLMFLGEALDVLSSRDCGLILSGFHPMRSARYDRVFHTARQRNWVGRNSPSRDGFQLTAEGRRQNRLSIRTGGWSRRWDGKWRLITYDLPMSRRSARQTLWRRLRARKLGQLQQSVWIWPHDIASTLTEITDSAGIPECFCGFESKRLLLCSNEELVRRAWDFQTISAAQYKYLSHALVIPAVVCQVRSLPELGGLCRIEHDAYADAFRLDPFLPRPLNPPDYRGYAVERRHTNFWAAVRDRARKLTDL